MLDLTDLMSAPPLRTTAPNAFARLIKNRLKKAIVTSKRRGAWFSLDKCEKSIVYLAIRLDVKFTSLDLLRSLTSIMKKLEQHGETVYAWMQRGTRLAWAFSEFAVSAGNKSAAAWRNDKSYSLFLGKVFTTSLGGNPSR
jgi:hypothetical protein